MRYEIGQANRLGNRNTNQDRFAAIESVDGVLLVLGDGMGGRPGGEVAAQTLVDTARDAFLGNDQPLKNPEALLERILLDAHQHIIDNSLSFAHPPGTTGVLCLVDGQNAYWAHVGDSRLYLFRDGLPMVRTTDHSYVEELYRSGAISSVERESHPRRNQITQCLGYQESPPRVEHGKLSQLRPGDVLLLCTDGLWGALDDAQIGMRLSDEGALDDSLNGMAEQAELNSYPNSDNISILALRMEKTSRPVTRPNAAPNPGDPLQDAIASIEQAFRQYSEEMDDDEAGDEEQGRD